jgi:hypothetical protein
VPRVELGKINIIYNIPHPSILLYIPDRTTCNTLLLLIQEVKRDIIYRRMNLPPSAQKVTAPQQLAAHIDSTLRRLCSYLQYIGIVKFENPQKLCCNLKKLTLPDAGLELETMLLSESSHNKYPYPLPTTHYLYTTRHTQHIKLDYITIGTHNKNIQYYIEHIFIMYKIY